LLVEDSTPVSGAYRGSRMFMVMRWVVWCIGWVRFLLCINSSM
jgi:hypothetical protein